ncbi:MAG: 4Fe-4S binding protein [Saprospiraceae bacterium]
MKTMQHVGIGLFFTALVIFTAMLGLNKYTFNSDHINIDNIHHATAIKNAAESAGLFGKTFESSFAAESALKAIIKTAQKELDDTFSSGEAPSNVSEWDYKFGDWAIKSYSKNPVISATHGPVNDHPMRFFFLTFGLAILGGLLFIIPKFFTIEGIKNNGVYKHSLTRGLTFGWRAFFLIAVILGILAYGVSYMGGSILWPVITAVAALITIALVIVKQKDKENKPNRSASADVMGWLGMIAGIYFIIFYILLYWMPQHISAWTIMVSPISKALSGNAASQWFLYGLMYSTIVIVMSLRMIAKYRHNKYQLWRTSSVMFFQTAFAFLIPEILVRLNQPWYDFKNIWPLDYDFFFNYNLNELSQSGGLGIFMLVWGILLTLIGVPLFTYFFGKRWYCSWVCGCGGLAETMGDPYRQLSDKSLSAWRYERWIIHGVLLFAVIMTLMVLYTYFSGNTQVLFFNSDSVRNWYGFLIGSAFAGIVGTGFYPLMGNRVWCRFGCPLAAYLGLVQKLKSRFRITTNGGQCISCGNCSTYCEMGIDVRWYAQRGQDIVRSSCVGCGICSAVCPRGVLRLENGSVDIDFRAEEQRTIHVAEGDVSVLNEIF